MQAISVGERTATRPAPVKKVKLPRRHQRLFTMLAGALAGALLGVVYLYLMMRARQWGLYAGSAALGAAGGLALVTIPGLIGAFLRKQWYQILLRQWSDKAQVLANAARRVVQEDAAEDPRELHNDLGVVDFLQRRFPEAAHEFEAAMMQRVPEATANLIPALAETGNWEQLREHLAEQSTLETALRDPDLARLAASAPEGEVLEKLWQVALRQRHPILLNNLGVRALRSQRQQQAARALELALERRPAYAYAHANLGYLAYRRGDLKKALAETASAAGLVSADETIFSNLGAVLVMAGDPRGAERWLRQAHKLQPRSGPVLVNLGLALHAAGQHEEATEALQHATHLPGFTTDAHYNLSLLHHSQGNHALSLEHLKAALAESPEDPDVLNNLGCLKFAQGQYQEAYDLFAQVSRASAEARYRRNIIRAELGARHTEAAQALLEEAGETDSLSLERGLLHLIRATQIEGETQTHRQMVAFNLSNAVSNLTTAIALGQCPAEAGLNYGLAQYLRGEYRAAAETLSQALKRSPNRGEMHYAAAMSFIFAGIREAGEHDQDAKLPGVVRELYLKARPHLEKASEVPSVAEVATYDLGLINYALGDYQRAIDVLRKIVRPDSPAHLVGALAIAQARLAQELQLTAHTASLMADGRRAEIRQQARQLLGSAIHHFKQVLQLEPEAPLAHANLGLALMLRNQKGDVEAALYHWQLMHQHGDARARKAYEQFMQAQSTEAAQRLRFQDVELEFRALKVEEWIVLVPPLACGPRHVLRDLPDVPEWQLQATHPLVQRALRYRQKAERMRRKLRRLPI